MQKIVGKAKKNTKNIKKLLQEIYGKFVALLWKLLYDCSYMVVKFVKG